MGVSPVEMGFGVEYEGYDSTETEPYMSSEIEGLIFESGAGEQEQGGFVVQPS